MVELSKRLKRKVKKKKIKEMTILQAIKLIKRAKGVPLLAPPWLDARVLKEKNFKRNVKAGLKVIEINNRNRYLFKKKRTNKRIKKLVRRYQLILTLGSDYHSDGIAEEMRGDHQLDKNNCDDCVVEQLKQAYKEVCGKWP